MDFPNSDNQPRRKLLRLPGVGVLLVVILFVVCAGVFVALRVAQNGIRQVEALGGGVSYKQNAVMDFVTHFIEVDDELLATDRDVRFFWLEGPQVTDDVFRVLRRFESVDFISIRKSNMSDDGLEHLTVATELTGLEIHNSPQITDVGVAKLARLPRLTSLHFEGMQVSGKGVAVLTQLEELNLNR